VGIARQANYVVNHGDLLAGNAAERVEVFCFTDLKQFLALLEHMHECDMADYGLISTEGERGVHERHAKYRFSCNNPILLEAFQDGCAYGLCVDVGRDADLSISIHQQCLHKKYPRGFIPENRWERGFFGSGFRCATKKIYRGTSLKDLSYSQMNKEIKGQERRRYVVPALCCSSKDGSGLDILWVRKDLRRNGIAKIFLRKMKNLKGVSFNCINHPLKSSMDFWEHMSGEDFMYDVKIGKPAP